MSEQKHKNKKNCNNCKLGLLGCNTLKNNKEFMNIFNENQLFNKKEWDFKENFLCDMYESKYIEYPIEVFEIKTKNRNNKKNLKDNRIGKFAKIRPCNRKYKNKTYLGLFLGELPIDNLITYNSEIKELNINSMNNPAIFVFDLNKIVYGCESWWNIIEKEEDLKNISDLDIENVWYVKVTKSLSNK